MKKKKKKVDTYHTISPDILITDSFDGYEYTFSPYYVGQHIKELRKKENYSQYELGFLIGVDKQYIKILETGTQLPPLEFLNYIAFMIFRVSLSFLLTGKEDQGIKIDEEDDSLSYSTSSSHQSLSPEEEVEEYLSGNRDFSDLSADAETWFFEEVDDD